MTRVVHVIDGLDVGGAEIMLWNLLRVTDLDRRPAEVISLTDIGPIGERIIALGVEVRALRMTPSPRSAARPAVLANWLRRARPDVLQTWLYEADLIGGLAARISGRRTAIVWGVHQSDLDPQRSKRHTLVIARANARLSRLLPDRIICCSSTSARIHEALGYDANRIVVVPNGFDVSAFAPDHRARVHLRRDLGLPMDTPLIGMIARWDPQKDHRNLIEAMAGGRNLNDAHVVLCGSGIDGENRELVGWIDARGLRQRFHLLGRRDDIPSIAAALDVAASPSAYGEAFPLAIGEAMACGVPCVVTDVGDCAHLVGDTGRVIPPNEPASLAQALSDVLSMPPHLRLALGAAARDRIESLFRLDDVARRYEAVQDEAVAKRAHGR